MTRTRTTPCGAPPARGRSGEVVSDEAVEWIVPGLLEALEGTKFAVLLDQRDALRWPRYVTPAPDVAARANGAEFDVEAVLTFLKVCRTLRHIKGRRFARRRFLPDLWQVVFVLGPVFGWKRDGLRIFRTLYLEVPRKNGKSTLAAAVAIYLTGADGEPGAEVVSAARDKDQARAVFDVAAYMVLGSPAVRKHLRPLLRTGIITRESNGSSYRVISSDRKGKSKHGLNLHGGVVDELHVIDDAELLRTLETSTGSRDQPLLVFITTAGEEDAGAESPWRTKRSLVVKLAERTVTDPTVWGVIYAADPKCALDGSWRDESTWIEANPGIGRSVSLDYFRSAVTTAEVQPSELNAFLRLHLNVPTESSFGFIGLGRWDRTASLVDEDDLEAERCYGGLDLASSVDLCALALVFPERPSDPESPVDAVMRFWTPGATLEERAHRDQAPYPLWVREGWITATPGESIDFDHVEAGVVAALDRFDVQAVRYDPWGSLQLRSHLLDAGAPLTDMRQGFLSMSPPMKALERLVVDRKIRHGGNPVLRYCVGNMRAVMDPAGNIKPDKLRSSGRIDGAVALIMALDGWLRTLDSRSSVYDERGLEAV